MRNHTVLLSKLFTRNPFGALKQHMDKAAECAFTTRELFEALFAQDKPRVRKLAKRISQLEHECDKITQGIRSTLTQSVLLPVERRDLFRLLHDMDNIADAAEDVGVLLTLRWMELPEKLQGPFLQLVEQALQTVREACRVIGELDHLLEVGFSGPEAKMVMDQIDAINVLEHKTDKAQDAFGRQLFAHEDTMKPAALFMWFKIAGTVSELADYAAHTAGHIRFMLSSN